MSSTYPFHRTFHLLTLLILLYILSFPSPTHALPLSPADLLSPDSSISPSAPTVHPEAQHSPQRTRTPSPLARLGRRQHLREAPRRLQRGRRSWDEDEGGDEVTEGGEAGNGGASEESWKKGEEGEGEPGVASATSWSPSTAASTGWDGTPAASSSFPSATATAAWAATSPGAVWMASPSTAAVTSPTTSMATVAWTKPSGSPPPPSSSPSDSALPFSTTPSFPYPYPSSLPSPAPVPGSASQDCALLDALYVSLGGASWVHTGGWAEAKEGEGRCCAYWGVECDEGGRVTGLDLAGNGLSGRLDKRVFGLGALGRLNLSNNALTGLLPDLFAQTPLLETVYLSSNAFSGPLPFSLLNSSVLVSLHLSNNSLTLPSTSVSAFVALEFPNAANLTALYLSHNSLSGPLGALCAPFNPRLARVVLDGNDLAGSLPDFADLVEAKVVSVAGNRLEGEVKNLGAAAGLVKLNLSNNSFTGDYPDPSSLSKLNYFNLASNAFTSPFPSTPAPPSLFSSPSGCALDPTPLPRAQCPSSAALEDPTSLASLAIEQGPEGVAE
ncbi:hypothetical protein JCM6882_009152 [Rhodosporidiobolus microsporus]